MSFLELFLLALSLCFDTLAVSVAAGLQRSVTARWLRLRYVIVLALCQTAMPLAGWLFGRNLEALVNPAGRWVALLMLCFVGGKMIREALSPGGTEMVADNPFQLRNALLVGFATSLDALAVGVSLAMVQARMRPAALLFFSTTAMAAAVGLLLGRRLGGRAGGKAGVLGGTVLILIGLKIAFL